MPALTPDENPNDPNPTLTLPLTEEFTMSTTLSPAADRRAARVLRAVIALLLATVTAAAGATAASADTVGQGGWLRLAHLSPDTPEVDIALTNVATGDTQEFDDVGYADVSDYQFLDPGSYTVAMVPAGSPQGTTPVITQAVEIEDGRAYTVAAVGLNANLSGRVITDDLTAPSDDSARVRLIQASVSESVVDVATDTGSAIATDAAFGTVTGYAEVGAGSWNLVVTGAERTGNVTVDLEPGSVNTLFALDQGGDLSMALVQDSSGSGEMPTGGVATGGGGLYLQQQRAHLVAALVALTLVMVGAAATVVVVRARRGAA